MMRSALPWAFTVLGLIPLLWLAVRRKPGDPWNAAWWWMASGFGVSTLADLAGAAGYGYAASQVYPVSQAALVSRPMLTQRWWVGYVALLLAAASASVVWRDGLGMDVALRVVAFGGVAVMGWRLAVERTLETALLVYFGLGLLAWLAYLAMPGWWTYLGMQGTRVVGIALWCRSAWKA
jgi:hypothetical protein